MRNPEQTGLLSRKISRFVGNAVFKFWHGYTKKENQQFAYWQSIGQLLNIDGKLRDPEWIRARETQLATSFVGLEVEAYGRARLEDYCRHQGTLDDGRVVAHIPAFGTTRDQLARLGIESDTFEREYTHESSDHNLTVILPFGWSMRPDYNPGEDETFQLDTLNCQRFAGIYDAEDNKVVHIFYNAKPFPYEDNFRSYTHVFKPPMQ